MENQFDAIVVGSGPGGGTVARELAKRNKKVLILEWGNNKPIDASIPQAVINTGIPFKNVLFTYKMLSLVRSTTTGGSSVYFYATAFDPPYTLLEKYGIDIKAEIQEAKSELPIAPLKDELVGPMAKRIMDSAVDMGYDWKKFQKFVYQDKCRKNCELCNYGCPYGAKWNARLFVEEALKQGGTLITNAKVNKVITENNKAIGVEFTKNFMKHKAFAPIVIVSAGGIGSVVILRSSGIKNAGYDYFFDPLIVVMGSVKDIEGGNEFPMVAGAHIEDERYLMTDMTVPSLLYQGFAAEILRLDRLFAHKNTLTIMVKEKDHIGGKITDRGGVRKHLDPIDKESLLKGYARAKSILKNAGAKNIFKSWYIAAHPGGTAKINEIVDSNLQTKFENLYVCDCSVIPEAWGLPPSLTLIGLGKRLAKHICSLN